LISTAMVLVFAAVAAVFFLLVDSALGWGVRSILGVG
jgi:preprotein translocase subunit SecE